MNTLGTFATRGCSFGAAIGVVLWIVSCGGSDSVGGVGGGSSGHSTGVLSTGAGSCSDQCQSGLCDVQLGCVQCLVNSDCKEMGQPFCVAGDCRECSASTDCATGQSCFPGNNECHPSCMTNADCQQGNADICDTDSGACVECQTDMDCQQDQPLCDPVSKQCSECLQNSDCGVAQPICDLQNGHCTECLLDSQCPAGQACNDSECHAAPTPCTSDAGCSDGGHCNVQTGDCQECVLDTQCDPDQPHCSPAGQCVECLTNADCIGGGTCQEFQCQGG